MASAPGRQDASGNYTLRLFHISDLHARGAREGKRAWKRAQVLGDEWLRNLEELTYDGRGVDLVVFTGDVADWGLAAEYADATQFIQTTLERLNVSAERLFVVPGNHDVNRKTGEAAWARLRQGIKTQAQAVAEWIAGLSDKAPFGFDPAWRDEVLTRTQAFWDWVEHDLGRGGLVPEHSAHGRLGYSVPVPGLPVPVRVIGLDSAWLAGDDADAGNLWLTEDQLGLLCHNAEGKPWPGFRLALVHHPLSDLVDHATASRYLADTVDLVLRGHQHDPIASANVTPGHTLRELAAGCLFEGSLGNRHPNGCSVIDVTFDQNGCPRAYDIRFRSWSPNGYWHDDSAIYREAEGGWLRWNVSAQHTVTNAQTSQRSVAPAGAMANSPSPLRAQWESRRQPDWLELLNRDELRMLAMEILRVAAVVASEDADPMVAVHVGRQRCTVRLRKGTAANRHLRQAMTYSTEMIDALEERIRFLKKQQEAPIGLVCDFSPEIRHKQEQLDIETATLSETLTYFIEDFQTST